MPKKKRGTKEEQVLLTQNSVDRLAQEDGLRWSKGEREARRKRNWKSD